MTTTATAKATTLFVLYLSLVVILSCGCAWLGLQLLGNVFSVVGVLLVLGAVVYAARATMLTCITVVVLLAFAGTRRRVLARRGSKITKDVAMHLVRVVVREKGLFAFVLAAILSCFCYGSYLIDSMQLGF